MTKLQLRDHEVTLFLKGSTRTSTMAATLLAAILVQNDRSDERKTSDLVADIQDAMGAVNAHRCVENMPRDLVGMDFVEKIVESNTLTEKLESVFRSAGLDREIMIEVRDPYFSGSKALDMALDEFRFKTGLSVTVTAAQGMV
ncbi:hypothetical protein [Pseudomonas putida]|uniref:Uncharacterized protein n=1 Tax=Pseudomonas putida TaxID=303 RepID=A0A8I1EID6_PSEPU|nr:hypothetical protein [Pseudomonas putida]MBI6885754.1 hypothetical protein [Pseudomonas putida]